MSTEAFGCGSSSQRDRERFRQQKEQARQERLDREAEQFAQIVANFEEQ